ncbi:MAG: thiamine ABC transporter substrate-binding protein [Actinobacteria bacterium]|nr:thiamine ABC transporter substrate-binding protein [Actinomycetota bacterium]MBU1866337.1 thiamine ABC transporter substrate-binding protein [Actinomycetota bacterium]
MKRIAAVTAAVVVAVTTALLLPASAAARQSDPVRLLTHESFAVSQDVLDAFTVETGYPVVILTGGDAGQIVNQAILAAGNPVADVLFGVDTTFLSRALDGGVFEAYESPGLGVVPPGLRADPRVTPIDIGDVCLNYDKAAFVTVPPPQTLDDLTDPAYAGMLVVENPATSSPGLAFLLATIARFGESGDYTWQDYWADLRRNGVAVTQGWEEAYYGSFSGGSGEGDRPLVVSYASSPAAEVVFATEPTATAPTGVITDGCFHQVEYAGILAGTTNRAGAEALIDFMLSDAFQEDVPLNMFVFPASTEARLPDVFVAHAAVPAEPETVAPAAIEQNRERWVDEWTAIVLRDPSGTRWGVIGASIAAVAVLAFGGWRFRRRRR